MRDLSDLIWLRNNIESFELTSYGFTGVVKITGQSDIDNLKNLSNSGIRELYDYDNNKYVDTEKLKNDSCLKINFDLSEYNNYYENFDEFLEDNLYKLKNSDFYIHDLSYRNYKGKRIDIIDNYMKILDIIGFLKDLSSYDKISKGKLELYFHKPDQICSLVVNYNSIDCNELKILNDINDIRLHVLQNPDKETRIKFFTIEMIQVLSSEGFIFKKLLTKWDNIANSYKNTFSIYLSEFSFEKIKTSSQQYFQELTDRIYSTIHKFTGYILAIPVAYILIIRFFDFEKTNSLFRDTLLLVIGILYFIVIWFVFLNNLNRAFETIILDINRFIDRIKGQDNLKSITESLEEQKDSVIPKQKNKIIIIKTITLIILLMMIVTYGYLYYPKLLEILNKIKN